MINLLNNNLKFKAKYVFNAFLASSQSINYNFNKNIKKTDLNSIYKILKYFFTSLSSFISKPVFLFSSDKINIRLFYFTIPSLSKLKKERKINKLTEVDLSESKKNKTFLNEGFKSLQLLKNRNISTMVSLNKDKLKYLVFILEKAFNKTIILDLVRLKYPYHESNILSQILGLSSKKKNFRKLIIKLLYTATIKNPTKMIRKQNFSIIPSYLSGIKVRLAGRLITQRVVPRFTVQSI